MEEKKCNKCKEVKSLSEFGKDKIKKDGLLGQIYDNQKQNSKAKGFQSPNYTKKELNAWCKKKSTWSKLFIKWKESGYKKDLIPSVDRMDDYKGYILDNIQLMTWGENKAKGEKDIKEGRNNKNTKAIFQYTKEGIFIKEYYSIQQAGRCTGIWPGNIWKCCKGKRKTTGSFIWQYKN